MRAILPLRPGAGLVAEAALLAAALVLVATPARAQLRWDVGAEAGGMVRGTYESMGGPGDRGLGPVFELQGHVALVPMVRIGAYFSYDIAPIPTIGTRTFYESGLHMRFTPPLLPAPWRLWAFGGLGAAYVYAASYHETVNSVAPQPVDVVFSGNGGGMLEVPLGFGLGYRLRGLAAPWVIFAELGGRLGVWYWGALYRGDPPYSKASGYALYGSDPGKDSFALSVSLGLSFEP
jgi:hypothetical protein